MSNHPTPPRLFGEKEVTKLLKRATELQAELPGRSTASGGLSLEDLESIGLEAGIDPQYLRRAAQELEAGDLGRGGWTWLTGDPLTLVRETVLPGEIPNSAFENVVGVVQQFATEHGQPSVLGRTLTWQAETSGKTRSIMLIVSARRGETHIRIEERLHQFASGLFGGVVAGGGLGIGLGVGLPWAGAVGSALLGFAFPVGIVGLSYFASREIYRAVVRHRRGVLGGMMERVTEEVAASIAHATVEAPAPTRELPSGDPSEG